MQQPPGYEDKNFPNHVFLMQLFLYGFKQAPRAWFNRLHEFLVFVGFSPSKTYVSLFIYSNSGVQLYVLVYVDDILMIGTYQTRVTSLA